MSDWSSDVCSSDLRRPAVQANNLFLAALASVLRHIGTPLITRKSPLIPYETQLIGAFLYAAGYAGGLSARSDNPSAPMPVTLLPQTPLDRSFRSAQRRVGQECVSTSR